MGQISTVFWPVYHVAVRNVFRNRTFETCIKPWFSESVASKMHQLWGSCFFWICWKYNLSVKNGEKNPEKFFCFRDNCVWVCCIKLSLLRREYFWPAVNVLQNSPKILRITKREFSNLLAFKVINKYCKIGVIQISALFDLIYHVACQRVLWNTTF